MLSKTDWQVIDKEAEAYRALCCQAQQDKNEAQAEIARLQAEVERLEKDALSWASLSVALESDRRTARNDALEEAARLMDARSAEYASDAARFRGGSNPHHARDVKAQAAAEYAAAIRAMKHPPE